MIHQQRLAQIASLSPKRYHFFGSYKNANSTYATVSLLRKRFPAFDFRHDGKNVWAKLWTKGQSKPGVGDA